MTRPVFDDVAPSYDAAFTETPLGMHLRRAVWQWLDAAFPPDSLVLELNCGTGADALHLLERGVRLVATDASAAMLDVARAKCDAYIQRGSLELRELPVERLDTLHATPAAFAGAFSNFGGLNCVRDLNRVAASLATLLESGAHFIACIMGPLVPWEWGWYLARGDVRRAFRRLRPDGAEWHGLPVFYPTIGAVRRAFAPWFRLQGRGALGVLLPPTFASAWTGRHPALLDRLASLERRIERWPLMSRLADHYIVDLVRR